MNTIINYSQLPEVRGINGIKDFSSLSLGSAVILDTDIKFASIFGNVQFKLIAEQCERLKAELEFVKHEDKDCIVFKQSTAFDRLKKVAFNS